MSVSLQPVGSCFGFFDGIGGMEMVMVAFVAFLLFGGKNLPGFARTLGRTMREFRRASGDVQREIRRAIDEAPEEDSALARRPDSTVPRQEPFTAGTASHSSSPELPTETPYPVPAPTAQATVAVASSAGAASFSAPAVRLRDCPSGEVVSRLPLPDEPVTRIQARDL